MPLAQEEYIMDDSKALGIVSALASGVNPFSGEVFPADSPYQSPDVVRALYAASRAPGSSSSNKTARLSASERRQAVDRTGGPAPARRF